MTRPLIDGFVGVTVFFCLSGYLITTVLLRELSSGTIDLRAFYRRRVARLCPALVLVVMVTTGVLLVSRHELRAGLAHRQSLDVGQVLAPAGAALTYTTSLFDWSGHPFATYDYFNYTWSLSVEEQFYLLWPFALLWGYRRGHRRFAAITLALVAGTLLLDLWLGLAHAIPYDQHEYFGSDANALPILAGCLLALAVDNRWLPRTRRLLSISAPLALALLVLVAAHDDHERPSLVTVAGTLLTLLVLIGVQVRSWSSVHHLLSSRPMRRLGELSYSIYLWNVLARIAVLSWLGHTLVGDVVWIAMFMAAATLSFRYVERPLRTRLGRPRDPGALPDVVVRLPG